MEELRRPQPTATGVRRIGWLARAAAGLALLVALPVESSALPLSRGDRVRLDVLDGDEQFTGTYQIDLNGSLPIPHLRPIQLEGLEPHEAEAAIERALVDQGFVQPAYADVGLEVQLWAPVDVFVKGQVFDPGRVTINAIDPEQQFSDVPQRSGDSAPGRFLTTAIRNAGGVRPDADLTAVELIRSGRRSLHDVSGVFSGEPFRDVPLLAGDQVIVPVSANPNPDIMRTSQISPPGVKVYLSNLTEPTQSNALSGSKEATGFSYGSRLVQAITSAACVGGSNVNKDRFVVHGRANRATGEVYWMRRPIEDVLKGTTAANGETNNPLLMNNDVVACYDSRFISLREVGRAVSLILSPVNLMRGSFFWPRFQQ
ncbi:polysaccharide export protein [Synechococcus sp. RSCCF101]|uniref:polysaccharide biosynthesis/export family protein n=1 Tax=Synechococcus sp. RSCCF101 TaxID=2511069 RepID=UPI0012471D8F|nr:polysaccharide biosynthesis/export family protein [Synechococcus sp. RSCCF101]QEY31470.1 polysaccharide export protein [Synechococcus sp. RSCCF101]